MLLAKLYITSNMATDKQKINEIVMEKLDLLSDKINTLSINLASLPEVMAEKFDERYASKRTELAVDRLAWLVITSVVGAIIIMVIK